MKAIKILAITLPIIAILAVAAGIALARGPASTLGSASVQSGPVGTGFIYQGNLDYQGSPANGDFDFIFRLFDADIGGTQIGTDFSPDSVTVVDGLFAVTLDFGDAFNGEERWLEIEVKPSADRSFSLLTPRQPLKPTPYAIFASDGPFWALGGNSGILLGKNYLGTLDNQALFLGANGTSVVTVDVNGNVGVGTTSPQSALEIANAEEMLRLDGTSGSYLSVRKGIDHTSNGHIETFKGNSFRSALYLNSHESNDVVIAQGGGNVGIGYHPHVGPEAPQAKLHVKPESRNDVRVAMFESNEGNPVVVDKDGNVGIGTTSPNEQLELTGNLRLPHSTASSGVIMSDGDRFIHNCCAGASNFFAGVNAGNLTMAGVVNTGVGVGSLLSNTSGDSNTAVGKDSLKDNTTGDANTAVGLAALENNTIGNENTATGLFSLFNNTVGQDNMATGFGALVNNTTGSGNTAAGYTSLARNATGTNNTAVGYRSDVTSDSLFNATAIGANAVVDASNKIRLGNSNVAVIEGQVSFTSVSDANQKENFLPVDSEHTLRKFRDLTLASWNYKGHDPHQFRHYGPTAQQFFAAFGKDDMGTIGTETTINSGDIDGIMMVAIQALEKRTADLEEQRARITELEQQIAELKAEDGSPISLSASNPILWLVLGALVLVGIVAQSRQGKQQHLPNQNINWLRR